MYIREYVKDVVKSIAESYGFEPIECPSIEFTKLFIEKSGQGILEEIYYFKDKSGRDICLVPEVTPQIARVIVSNKDLSLPIRFYYFAKLWRYEEPQKNRYRELYQFGFELVGTSSILAEMELLSIIKDTMDKLGLDYKIEVNDRRIFDELLANVDNKKEILRVIDKRRKLDQKEFEELLANVCPKNVIVKLKDLLRILDYDLEKALNELSNIVESKEIIDYWRIFAKIAKYYGLYDKIKFSTDIVRGLDYYTSMVFEVYSPLTNVAIAGGGRYDNLISIYSDKSMPAVGFAFGFDRLVNTFLEVNKPDDFYKKIDYYIYYFNDKCLEKAIEIAKILRKKGFKVVLELDRISIRRALEKMADKAKYMIIIGDKELEKGIVKLKDLEKKEEKEVSMEDL